MTPEAELISQNFANFPAMHSDTTTAVARELLLSGEFFAFGDLYQYRIKRLGCGVVRVSAELAHVEGTA